MRVDCLSETPELASGRHMQIHLLCPFTHGATNFHSEPWLIILDNVADLQLTYKKKILWCHFQQHWDL